MLSVAPMMDWTDRHCRFFHRVLSRHTRLYSEMVTARAVIYGDCDRLLGHCPQEHPLALQLGGAEPGELAKATEIAASFGYDEVNLNCGCPSSRVQSGSFGVALMHQPARVSACLSAMKSSAPVEITVKCRIGVDDDTPAEILPQFLNHVSQAGISRVIIHARKAWLKGLSPKDNRTIPPLDYGVVEAMRIAFPELEIVLNGGITTLKDAKHLLDCGFDGVMVGRAAYQNPGALLGQADRTIFSTPNPAPSSEQIIQKMADYLEAHLSAGGLAHQVTRHMLGLFCGQPGARAWRHTLSHRDGLANTNPEILWKAFGEIKALECA